MFDFRYNSPLLRQHTKKTTILSYTIVLGALILAIIWALATKGKEDSCYSFMWSTSSFNDIYDAKCDLATVYPGQQISDANSTFVYTAAVPAQMHLQRDYYYTSLNCSVLPGSSLKVYGQAAKVCL
jgi:hypothetical protein